MWGKTGVEILYTTVESGDKPAALSMAYRRSITSTLGCIDPHTPKPCRKALQAYLGKTRKRLIYRTYSLNGTVCA